VCPRFFIIRNLFIIPMKRAKRQTANTPKGPCALTPEQQQRITLAWHALLNTHLPPDLVWVAAPFEQEDGAWYLRAYIDTADKTITLDQCAAMARLLNPLADALPIPESCPYALEVSSPGLFRQLTTPKEWQFYQGEPVLLTRPNLPDVAGVLGSVTDDKLTVLAVAAFDAPVFVPLPLAEDTTLTLNYSLTKLEDAPHD
jgi:ribosome maturation factor RimP